jgi:hypothetical protein
MAALGLPENSKFLRSRIRDKDLFIELESLWDSASKLQDLQRGMTDQSHTHCLRVESAIWLLICEDIEKFKDIDIFVLSASAALHDIGKVHEGEKEVDHGEIAKKELLKEENWKKFFKDRIKAEAVGQIVGVHSNGKIDELPEGEFPIGDPPGLLLRSLAAIFRLADMLDSDYRRCPYIVRSFKKLSFPADLMTWVGRSSIAGWKKSHDERFIVLCASPANESDKIKTMAYLDSLNCSFTESQRKHLENCQVKCRDEKGLHDDTLHFPSSFVLEISGKIEIGLVHLFKEVAEEYISRVSAIYSDVDLKGIGDYTERNPAKLSKVYVDVQVTLASERAPQDFGRFDEKAMIRIKSDLTKKSMPVTEAINIEKLDRILLLGEPGSGKTTICKYLCINHSKYGAEGADAEPCNNVSGLPFLVTIRDFASQKAKQQSLTLLQFLENQVRSFNHGRHPPEGFVEYYLSKQTSLSIFDGLDEVISPSDRKEMRNMIEAFATKPYGTRIVVTSREVGYDEAPLDVNRFLHLRLMPLQGSQIEIFIRNWYEEREPNQDYRAKYIESFMEAMKEKHVAELASNPLLLTIMALVHGAEAELPKQRALLYKKCVEAFLVNRDRARGLVSYDADEVRMCHDLLGYRMYERAEKISKSGSEMPLEELKKHLLQVLKTEDKVKDFINAARARVGLLVEREGIWSFGHRSFEEYFAARYISQKTFGIDGLWAMVQDKIEKPHWTEVLKLLAGIYDDTNKQALKEFVGKLIREDSSSAPTRSKLVLAGEIIGDKVSLDEEFLLKTTADIIKVFLETRDKALMNNCKMVLDHLFGTAVEDFMVMTLRKTDTMLYITSAFYDIYRSPHVGDTRIDRLIGNMGTLKS